ncbi:MAG: tRNA guanosine(34) transglycosylase Tgt [Patescibacteria group bacterium]
MFKLLKQSKKSQARLGKLKTNHGEINTPFFMPIATKAAVKNLTAEEMKELGAQIILSNTYHLYLQPGMKIMKKAGGLHQLMNWDGPILTDSGGFQVFSLSKIRKILPGGVEFRSHLDGSRHFLTPKKVLAIQKIIGSDIAMVLDVCPPSDASRKEIEEAVNTTTKWAQEVKSQKSKVKSRQQIFGIIQGGIHKDLRLKSLKEITALDFDGYAIGGLAVGETNKEMYKVLDYLTPEMPADKPRYLMGVGTPENIIEAVGRGVDMFDCVIPTREARHGRLYLNLPLAPSFVRRGNPPPLTKGRVGVGFNYQTINILNSRYKADFSPINNTNLKHYTKAYLHHLFKTGEPLAMRLATLNNLDFYLTLMAGIRQAIRSGRF